LGPLSPLYNGYWVSFQGVKWPGHGIDHPLPSSTKVKETVKPLYDSDLSCVYITYNRIECRYM